MPSISIVSRSTLFVRGKKRKKGRKLGKGNKGGRRFERRERGRGAVGAGYNEISLKGPLHVGSVRVNKNEWLSS